MAIACLAIDGWMSVAASRTHGDIGGIGQVELLSTTGFVVFVIGGIASLVSALPVPWYVVVRRTAVGALLIIVVSIVLLLLFVAIPHTIQQIWWVRRPVIAHQLNPDGAFDPNKPFKILNPDGSEWLVPSGKYVPSATSPSATPATSVQSRPADDDDPLAQFIEHPSATAAPSARARPSPDDDLGEFRQLPDRTPTRSPRP